MSDQSSRPLGQPRPVQASPDAGQPGQPHGHPGTEQGPYSQSPGRSDPGYLPEPDQPTGLAITALVLGIVSFLMATTPLIGVVSFLLGPVAIVFGVIAMRKRQKKVPAITGLVLGAAAVVIAGAVTAITVYVAAQAFGEHTVRYVVTSDQPANVTYFNGADAVPEQITGHWQKEISYSGLPYGSISVDSTGTATVSCQLFMDGRSASANSGSGQVDCVSGNMQFWKQLPGLQ